MRRSSSSAGKAAGCAPNTLSLMSAAFSCLWIRKPPDRQKQNSRSCSCWAGISLLSDCRNPEAGCLFCRDEITFNAVLLLAISAEGGGCCFRMILQNPLHNNKREGHLYIDGVGIEKNQNCRGAEHGCFGRNDSRGNEAVKTGERAAKQRESRRTARRRRRLN